MEKSFDLWDSANKKIITVTAKKSGKEYSALCPFHEETTPSLFINEEKQLYNCHGCQTSGRLYDPNFDLESNITAIYDYPNQNKKLKYQVCRMKLKGPKKDFKQRRPDERGGWYWNLDNVEPLPYRLPEILDLERPIFIVEGEKDVDNLYKIGICATCNSGGAGKWKPELNKWFKDRKVYIIPDNDPLNHKTCYRPGELHAHQVANQLHKIAEFVGIIYLPDIAEKQDTSDWIEKHGGTKEKLVELAKKTPEWKPEDKPKKAESDVKNIEPSAEALQNIPFKFLGYNYGFYFYLPDKALQVVELSREAHTKKTLMSIAPLNWWERAFPSTDGKFHTDSAINWMYRQSEFRGTYDDRKVRGCGAWYDDGRIVLHLGDKLHVDGESIPIEAFHTKYIYEVANPIHIDFENHLSNVEAHKLLEITKMFACEKLISAYLLASWCICAIICGALNWRPHIWITGAIDTGKTWIISNIIQPVVGSASLYVQSNTTEAGIRQRLRNHAFPVIFDEAEGEEKTGQNRIQSVVELARQASSENDAVILKGTPGGTAQSFRIRSSFCMASIGINIQ